VGAAESGHGADALQPPLVPRSGFQWQVKRNVFSRKEGKSSGSNKDVSHKTPIFATMLGYASDEGLPLPTGGTSPDAFPPPDAAAPLGHAYMT
jgi:hypothetical protein